jgi:type II secretory pathway pseudopilin PulG
MRYIFESLNSQKGVMLIELLIVILIIGLLITGAVKTWDVTIQQTKFSQTVKEMDQLVYAIAGNPELTSEGGRSDFGYVGDMGAIPDTLLDLVRAPDNMTNWHGPYIKSNFAENADDYIKDAWGNSYVYNKDSLIITSYTSGSNLTPQTWIHRRIAQSETLLLYNTVSGRISDLLGKPPGPFLANFIKVFIIHPLNGIIETLPPLGEPPNENGEYTISAVPEGNHKMFVTYDEPSLLTADTVEKYVCVFPGIVNNIDFRLTVEF